ncbi:hypothetical protein [Spiroplasma endosymbiont of Othius punctulatus]|uniref:aldose epimerase family protein n=1 Tax=Spiroplasma endosymbiont of Othius punctulatus TaxID=3066289 RepID=UPI0030CCAA06
MEKIILKNNYNIGGYEVGMNPSNLKIEYIKYKGENIIYNLKDSWKEAFPILFPVCGKLNDDKYTYNNEEYKIRMHGFLHELNWILEDKTKNCISFKTTYDNNSFQKYPFKFEIMIDIFEIDETLKIRSTIKNIDNKLMYYNFGYHPSFSVSGDSVIKFPAHELFSDGLNYNSGFMKSDFKYNIKLKEFKLNELNFSEKGNTYLAFNSKIRSLNLINKKTILEISFDNKNDPNILLWQMGKKKEYVCIEPWWGLPDYSGEIIDSSLGNKQGILTLKPNQSETFDLSIQVKSKKEEYEN